MASIRRVCIYCGSRVGARPTYVRAAARVGTRLAEAGIGVVTGGGSVGLMGVVADAALAAGGEVTGIIPQALQDREVGHATLSALHVVGTMHERKAMMSANADAFVALPGGLGTLEEIAEALTWAQLGIHAKPCAFLDVDGYYAPLVHWLDHTVAEGFVDAGRRAAIWVEADADALVDRLLAC
ncbi:TIGR00730 family Rossman fold protein [Rubrivirga sp. IMCC43871]|uniref:LOG family protein n=1 Tax=Rubrivirga sp. IMCC43871 TaxID=3391575 RepID=UPI0039901A47